MESGSFSTFCRNATAGEVQAAINAGTTFDEEALFKAATNNPDPSVIHILVNEHRKKFKTDIINATDYDGNTALHKAAGSNPNPLVVKALIDLGADVKARNNFNHGPVYSARMNFQIWKRRRTRVQEVLNLLLSAGADDERI